MAVGNAIGGIPLDERGVFAGGFFDLLGPYQVLVGLLAVALFAMHGAIYLFLKTEGAVQERLGKWMWHTWGVFLVLYLLTTMLHAGRACPRATANFEHYPWAAAIVLVNVLAIANIPRAIFSGQVRPGVPLLVADHRRRWSACSAVAVYPEHRHGEQRPGATA